MKKKIDTLTEKEIKKAFNADIKAGNYQLSFEGNKVTLEKVNRKTTREAKNCITVTEDPRQLSWRDSLSLDIDWGKWDNLWTTPQPSQQQANASGTLTMDHIQTAIDRAMQNSSRQVEEQMYMSPRTYGTFRTTTSFMTDQERQARLDQERLSLRGLSEQLSSQSGVYDARMAVYQAPISGTYMVNSSPNTYQVYNPFTGRSESLISVDPEGSVRVTEWGDGSTD